MERLETRELAYFVAVAEELHFGQAAQRLGIAQPPLSRAIKQLERRMGVPLLERSSRAVRLTEAGEVLLAEGRKALDSVAAATRRTRRVGWPDPTLALVTKPGGDAGLLSDILACYESDPAAVAVEVQICGIGEQAGMLRDGRADMAFLHLPFDDVGGFDTTELLIERQVAVLPRAHRLAKRASLRLADLEGEPRPRFPGGPTAGATGPEVHDSGQLLHLIALGRVVAVLPESVRVQLGSDLVCVPVTDAPTTSVLLAWPERSRSRSVAAFVHAAETVAANRGPRPHATPA